MVRYAFLFLTLFSICPTVIAQSGYGSVNGTVLDSSGAFIRGAKLLLTNVGTNALREASSSDAGLFVFAEIPPARYRLEVQYPGFEKWQSDFVVQTGQTASLQPKLTVGSVSDTVVVNDAASPITTEGMQIADVKDALQIHQLPLNGRQITNLFDLTAGVEGGGAARTNGLKVGSLEIVQDGVSLVDRFGGGIQRVQPGLDTIQEFRIETNGSSARYPRPATVTLVTKSGSNQLHGSLFETMRNNAGGLRARARQDGNSPAKLIRNEFGASAGGPIVLPRLYDGHNKTFFFVSYEGNRQREALFYEDYVPTTAMFNGDFGAIFDNNRNQTHIYDPLTTDSNGIRTPFPGDLIPGGRISPFFGIMKTLTHTPTNPGNPFQAPNLDVFYPISTDTNSFTVRGDHRFSANDSLQLRYTKSTLNRVQTGGMFGAPAEGITNAGGTGLTRTDVYTGTITETHIFRPNFLSETLLAVNRNPNHQGTLADFTNWGDKLGLPNPFGVNGWPTITAGAFPGNNWDANNSKDQNLTAFHLENNLTFIKGKHTMLFGGRVRHEYNNVRELQQAQGSHSFGEDWTALYDAASNQSVPYTGVGVASMALGLPTFLSNQFNRGYYYFRQSELGFYYHDSWRVSSKLTVELGLRWDKWTSYKEKYDRLVNVDVQSYATKFQVISPNDTKIESIPGVPSSVLASWANRGLTWTTANSAGVPSSLIPSPNNDFGPRIGLAYRLGSKTVIRGGYGKYFWTLPLSQILATSRTNPPLNLRYTNNQSTSDGTSTFGARSTPSPNFFVGKTTVDINGNILIQPTAAQAFFPYDFRNWNDTAAHEWNFTIERALPGNTALRLTYVGDRGSNLEQRYALNNREPQINYENRTGNAPPGNLDLTRVNPNWNFGNGVIAKNGYSNTHSVQAQIQKRYSNGLALQAFYVFTRSITTSDAGGGSSGNGSINDGAGGTLVPEQIQVVGAPKMTSDQLLRLVYYNSTAVPPHKLVWNGLYDLPFGKGKRFGSNIGGLGHALIGGWQIAVIGQLRSGRWLSVASNEYLFGNPTLSSDQRLNLTYNGRSQRLYFAGDFDPTKATNVDLTQLQALVPVNRAVRVLRPLGPGLDNRIPVLLANGTTRLTSITDTVNWNARAFILGPTFWNTDASLFKTIRFSERLSARVTADFFNAFNHPNNASPNSATGLQDLSIQTNEPRIIQFSLRLSF